MKYAAVISDGHHSVQELEKDVLEWADRGFEGDSPVDTDEIMGDLYLFELPDGISPEIALRYGQGLFFDQDWSSDGTVSVVIPMNS